MDLQDGENLMEESHENFLMKNHQSIPRSGGYSHENESMDDNPTATELPMVVWLRGDEPYFSEFTLNADEVMQILGIKRSRLTQLSGKELRVGRTRIDRYIRPIYRQVDVEKYLNWTRKTASHKRSSEALEQAAKNLDQKSNQLSQEIFETKKNFSKDIADNISATLSLNDSKKQHTLNQIHQLLEKSYNKQFSHLEDRYGHLKRQLQKVFNTSEKNNEISAKIDALISNTSSLMTEIQDLKLKIHNNEQKTTQLFEELHKDIAEVTEHIYSLNKSQRSSIFMKSRKARVQLRCTTIKLEKKTDTIFPENTSQNKDQKAIKKTASRTLRRTCLGSRNRIIR
ncbi:MAG: hypothetical protein R3B45_12340 [Bdellovibrionota bacterium]